MSNPRVAGGETRADVSLWTLLKKQWFVLAIGLLLMAVNRVCGLALPYSTKFLIDDVLEQRRHDLLVPIVCGVLLATLLQGITAFITAQIIGRSGYRILTDWRCIVQRHVIRLRVAYFDANKTGVLVSRIMGDLEGLRTLAGTGLVDFVGAVLAAVLALVVMTRISVLMTGMACGIILVFGFGLYKGFRTLQPMFKKRAKIHTEVAGRLHESLAGVRVVKSYRAEERESAVFASGLRNLLTVSIQLLTKTSTVSLAATLLVGLVGSTVAYIGIHRIITGQLTLGGFVAFTTIIAFLISPVFQMVAIGSQMSEALAGLERTRELLAISPEDEDARRTKDLHSPTGHVEFRHVSFAYEPSRTVLNDISFESLPGTVTAIVGPSGVGKSTLISLVLAVHNPAAGQITVDGLDLSTIQLDSYRKYLGVVLQDTFLFDGSIRDNVAFSRPDATDEEIYEACRLARIDEFAESLEHTYNTQVGECGVRLSGGQRQRISIARALLANPRILILDEATSNLDTESEALIRQALSNVMRGRTTFVIAHRLSTIRGADQILVLDQGRIVERGLHQELYARGGRYFSLYSQQEMVQEDRLRATEDSAPDGDPTEPGAKETARTPDLMSIASFF